MKKRMKMKERMEDRKNGIGEKTEKWREQEGILLIFIKRTRARE